MEDHAQKDKAGTLAEQGRSVNKTGTLAQHRRPVEEKVQRKGNSAVNEEQTKPGSRSNQKTVKTEGNHDEH